MPPIRFVHNPLVPHCNECSYLIKIGFSILRQIRYTVDVPLSSATTTTYALRPASRPIGKNACRVYGCRSNTFISSRVRPCSVLTVVRGAHRKYAVLHDDI